jgi:hypothetical protein
VKKLTAAFKHFTERRNDYDQVARRGLALCRALNHTLFQNGANHVHVRIVLEKGRDIVLGSLKILSLQSKLP